MVVLIDATDKHLEIFNSLSIPYTPQEQPPKPELTADLILKEVAAEFNKDPEELKDHTREHGVCYPRHIAVRFQRQILKMRWDPLQTYWGIPKDSVRYGDRNSLRLAECDKGIRRHVENICSRLGVTMEEFMNK